MEPYLSQLAADMKQCLDTLDEPMRLHVISELSEQDIYAWLAVVTRRGTRAATTIN
jgi:hypothetical protein